MIFKHTIPKPSSLSSSEGAVYESKEALVTYFLYPNVNKSDGIGLHTHAICDDIELLLSGSVYCYETQGAFSKHFAPLLIVNRPGVPHSIIKTGGPPTTLLSFRFPYSYEGTPIDIKPEPPINRNLKRLQQLFVEIDMFSRDTLLYKTDLSSGYFYSITNVKKELPACSRFQETFLLNIGDKAVLVEESDRGTILQPGGLLICGFSTSLTTVRGPKKGGRIIVLSGRNKNE